MLIIASSCSFRVISDMATPALARFGSDELKKQFLVPTIAGDVVACIGVSEVGSGSDVASIKTTAVPKKGMSCIYIFINYCDHYETAEGLLLCIKKVCSCLLPLSIA